MGSRSQGMAFRARPVLKAPFQRVREAELAASAPALAGRCLESPCVARTGGLGFVHLVRFNDLAPSTRLPTAAPPRGQAPAQGASLAFGSVAVVAIAAASTRRAALLRSSSAVDVLVGSRQKSRREGGAQGNEACA